MHSCCYCVADDGSSAGMFESASLQEQADISQLSSLTGLADCRPGFVRPECPDHVLSCEVVHSNLATCLTFLNDYIIWVDFVLHFFVGFKQTDPVPRMERTVWDPKQIARHFVHGHHGGQFWLMLLGSLPIDTYFRMNKQYVLADNWRSLRV
eukprot:COSAG02_NODE_21703_length_778_cov_0.835052_2_plen_151_part_01